VGRSAVSLSATLSPGRPLDVRLLRGQQMTDADGKCGYTVRIVVKLRAQGERVGHTDPAEIGSTMSAFLRESAARVMKEGLPHPARTPSRVNE
jgi:hypothetical protein